MGKKRWYATKGSMDQGIVADEITGENIAISYKQENAQLLATAPKMLAALRRVVENYENKVLIHSDIRNAQDAIYEAMEG